MASAAVAELTGRPQRQRGVGVDFERDALRRGILRMGLGEPENRVAELQHPESAAAGAPDNGGSHRQVRPPVRAR